jgi:hypothetical protein
LIFSILTVCQVENVEWIVHRSYEAPGDQTQDEIVSVRRQQLIHNTHSEF